MRDPPERRLEPRHPGQRFVMVTRVHEFDRHVATYADAGGRAFDPAAAHALPRLDALSHGGGIA